jgi:hypothetical protein
VDVKSLLSITAIIVPVVSFAISYADAQRTTMLVRRPRTSYLSTMGKRDGCCRMLIRSALNIIVAQNGYMLPSSTQLGFLHLPKRGDFCLRGWVMSTIRGWEQPTRIQRVRLIHQHAEVFSHIFEGVRMPIGRKRDWPALEPAAIPRLRMTIHVFRTTYRYHQRADPTPGSAVAHLCESGGRLQGGPTRMPMPSGVRVVPITSSLSPQDPKRKVGHFLPSEAVGDDRCDGGEPVDCCVGDGRCGEPALVA